MPQPMVAPEGDPLTPSKRLAVGDDELGVLVTALYDVANLARRRGVDDPVEPAGTRVLIWVQALGSPRPSELACRLQLDLSTVSRHVRSLTGDGYLATERDADDRRAQRLTLTEQGHQAIATVVANRRNAIGDAIAHWPSDDRARLTSLLRRLADDMTTDATSGTERAAAPTAPTAPTATAGTTTA